MSLFKFSFLYLFITLLLIIKSVSLKDNKQTSLSQSNKSIQNTQGTQQNTTTNNTSVYDLQSCSLVSTDPIKLSSGETILMPLASPKGLLGYYSFDYDEPIDESGKGNHAIGKITAGLAYGGLGASARFSLGNYIYIPHNNDFNSENFTITFWIFFNNDKLETNEEKQCPLIQKGKDSQNSFGIFYERETKHLIIFLYSTNGIKYIINSISKITMNKWYHIAVKKSTRVKKMKLYVNGIPDSAVNIEENILFNNESMYIGNSPNYEKNCQMKFFLDELRFFNVYLSNSYIQGEANVILGGVEPNLYRLGCVDCDLNTANSTCTNKYTLCSSIEMYVGGYQIARSLGLITENITIWTKNLLQEKEKYSQLTGLGMCCKIIE